MALEIRPIPTLTGDDAARFIKNADEAERRYQKRMEYNRLHPDAVKENPARETVRRMWREYLDSVKE
ncbi:MAG: hypothetical protein K5854_07950 [Prevotella sp.]|jgi:hypothetical protein|nr:hypothetical protein [Prevotella sp.]